MSNLDYLQSLTTNKKVKLISSIDWTKNFFTKSHNLWSIWKKNLITQKVDWYINHVHNLLKNNDHLRQNIKLLELEEDLKYNFTKEAKYLEIENLEKNIRIANCFAWAKTQIYRKVENIIIANWDTNMPTKTNMWKKVVDPIGWSSKSIAPSWWYNNWNPEWYWLLWKIPKLRPSSEKFDINIYKELMNTRVKISQTWIAIEYWPEEVVFMPTYKIFWGEDIIKNFSEPIKKPCIKTSKYYWINTNMNR